MAIGNCLIADVKINNLIERFQKCNLDGINKIVIRVTDKESM